MKEHGIKKLYYSISEVSRITDLEQYVLRYWETEFDEIKPSKNRAGNRIYTNKDIEFIFKVKKLLRDEKFTVEGAKKILINITEEPEIIPDEITRKLQVPEEKVKKNNNSEPSIKKDLEDIKNFLLNLQEKL